MASSATTISLSLATISCYTSSSSFPSSRNNASTCALKSYKSNFTSSSFFGKRVCVDTIPETRAINGRKNCSTAGFTCLASALPSALLFDCDGVLVDTEKDGHRISFNDTFNERELGVTWGVDLYGELLKIGGGKERMTAYFNKTGWPEKAPKSEDERKEFIASLHKRKTELFMALIEKKLLPLRPGVAK